MKNQLSFRERHSIVWLEEGRIYKGQPKYNTDNEYQFLTRMSGTGYVPRNVTRLDLETITMDYIQTEQVTDPQLFWSHYICVLEALRDKRIRHGDLTKYSVLVKNNKPILIDFSESRWMDDPITDKRPEGDAFWLGRTMEHYAPYQP